VSGGSACCVASRIGNGCRASEHLTDMTVDPQPEPVILLHDRHVASAPNSFGISEVVGDLVKLIRTQVFIGHGRHASDCLEGARAVFAQGWSPPGPPLIPRWKVLQLVGPWRDEPAHRTAHLGPFGGTERSEDGVHVRLDRDFRDAHPSS
jgi:hypothetical protein